MLPSITVNTDDDHAAGLPRLTVAEMRALRELHVPDITFTPATSEHGREWRATCACGAVMLPHRSYTDAADAQGIHVSACAFDARRAKARAALEHVEHEQAVAAFLDSISDAPEGDAR